ncbi:MAG: GreA/GreB family elongation factor [Candidatus Hydrogenedentes bacterium]|nr:GreA/GreB family elongation factor [Candidatus Hydrogenedentota bacterium]
MAKQIHITAQDRQRLLECLAVVHEFPDKRDLPHIRQLEEEIAQAQIIIDALMTPEDVVTMNSRVQLRDVTADRDLECTLTYPGERDPDNESVSVLAPLGAAILGYRVGDTFVADLPEGRTQFRIESVRHRP